MTSEYMTITVLILETPYMRQPCLQMIENHMS